MRRNVSVDNYGKGIHSWGITTGFLVEENVVDRNGGTQFNVLLHNLYLDGDNSNPGPVTLKGNIIARDISGSQIRIGGNILNNLWIQNPYAHNIGMPTAGVVSVIDNNVYTEAVAIGTAYGWGVDHMGCGVSWFLLQSRDTCLFEQHHDADSVTDAGVGIAIEAGYTETLSNNIFFKWPNPIVDQTGGTVTYTGYNVQDATGANNLGAPEPFPNPGRTVGTYYDFIVGSSGHTSFDFIAAARGQSKDNWNPALMAAAVNDYIRAGFGITTSNSPPPPPHRRHRPPHLRHRPRTPRLPPCPQALQLRQSLTHKSISLGLPQPTMSVSQATRSSGMARRWAPPLIRHTKILDSLVAPLTATPSLPMMRPPTPLPGRQVCPLRRLHRRLFRRQASRSTRRQTEV